jgi:hypothetical protein
MNSAPTEKRQAILAALEAERQRRFDEAIDSDRVIIVGCPEEASKYPADALLIVTGVPRTGEGPSPADAWQRQNNPIPSGPNVAIAGERPARDKPRPALEWRPVRTQVIAPTENSPGAIAEGRYAVVGGELRLEDQRGHASTAPIAAGDDAAALARKLLRDKHDRHLAFYDPIRYPSRSFH